MTDDMERDTDLLNMIEAVNLKVEMVLQASVYDLAADPSDRALALEEANARIRLAKSGLSKRGIR